MLARSLLACPLLSLLLILPAPARADLVPFTGSIGLSLAGLPPLLVPGSGVATVTFTPTDEIPVQALALPTGAFATSLVVPLPNAFPIVQLAVQVSNPAASFSVAGPACGTPHSQVTCSDLGTLHGRAGLAGQALVGIFGTASAPFANLTVPLGVVGGGSTFLGSSPLGITVGLQGAGWTSGTVLVPTLTDGMGGSISALIARGGQSTTGGTTGGGGHGEHEHAHDVDVLLVSPVSIHTNATGSFLPSLATWRIRLERGEAPEPGALLLLASAVLALACRGRRALRCRPGG